MKITVPMFKPRNPLVAAVMRRAGGPHRKREWTRRQRQGCALRRELVEMKHIP